MLAVAGEGAGLYFGPRGASVRTVALAAAEYRMRAEAGKHTNSTVVRSTN